MKLIFLYIILLICVLYIIKNTKDPENFTEVKRRYKILRDYYAKHGDAQFKSLKNPIILTGFLRQKNGNELGYNINKGTEIGLCLDGSPNEIMHVLIHELAHTVSSKYSHDEEFWNNVHKIENICQENGLYIPINNKTEFCGSHIKDPD
jgi:hypothetical protein